MIVIKRVKETPSEDDGYRVLVDRLWPVGMTKEKAKLDIWLKDLGPSNGLRKWFGHDIEKWDEFKKRYFEELNDKDELINTIIDKSKETKVTLLFNSKEHKFNNAAALNEYLESKMKEEEEEEIKPAEEEEEIKPAEEEEEIKPAEEEEEEIKPAEEEEEEINKNGDENGNDEDENGNDEDENGNDEDENGNDENENGNDENENGG